ncbi:MAG: 2TM domain-containing protein [Solirubrobacterales bacterium]|nr:2TM domain-containing protein [Solirubrobacterales bacterium]
MTDDARQRAKKRLEARRGFRQTAFVFLVVSLLLIGIWAISGQGMFWPIWPIGAFLIALAFQAWNVYGQKPITDPDVEAEMQKDPD